MLLIVVIAVLAAALIVVAFVQIRRERGGGLETLPPPIETLPEPPEGQVGVETPPVEEAPTIDEAPPIVEGPVAEEAPPAEQIVVERPRLRDRLGKARALVSDYLTEWRLRARVDDQTWDELEEMLLMADVGVGMTAQLLDGLRARAKDEGLAEADALIEALKQDVASRLGTADRALNQTGGDLNVWMFVGVNGTGKTTSIGKVARAEVAVGKSVVLVAADTFRAAAPEQLGMWAERVGAELVRAQEGADPGSVVFDAMDSAKGRNADIVLIDTAGRLHTKVNLMEELAKLRRIVDRTPGSLKEVLLVIDATTGQNGLAQARQFAEAVDVTGIVLTKLDGTAKGGIVLAIQHELAIPVKLVGVGERPDDLIDFDPIEFADALFA